MAGSASAQSRRTSRRPWRTFGSRTTTASNRPPRAARSRTSHRGAAGTPSPTGSTPSPQGGKRRLQVRQQRRLILFDRQQVVTPARHDLRADFPLRQQGVGRHQPPLQRHRSQNLLGRRQFVAVPRTPQLRQHHPCLVGVDADQMLPRQPLPMHPPQRLAVYRYRVGRLHPRLRQPASHRPLERPDVQRLKHSVQRRHARAPPRRQPQCHQQLGLVCQPLPPPLGHRRQAPRSAQHRRHRQLQQRHQRDRRVLRSPPIRLPRVRHVRQGRRQRPRRPLRPFRQRLAHPPPPWRLSRRRTLPLMASDEKTLLSTREVLTSEQWCSKLGCQFLLSSAPIVIGRRISHVGTPVLRG